MTTRTRELPEPLPGPSVRNLIADVPPATAEPEAETTPWPESRLLGVEATAQINEIAVAEDTVDAEVVRAPFSEAGIAERLAANPDFYVRLFRFAADELKREIVRFEAKPGEGNSAAVISVELIEFQRGFERVATDIEGENSDRFSRAATNIVAIRNAVAQFCETHPALVQPFFQIAAVTAGCYALHQIGGASGDIAALISYAIVKKEKLSDILKPWARKDHP